MNNLVPNEENLYQLIKDDNFLSLENQLSSFNVFDALGIETDENRHSSFLSFLLNPRESHQCGDLFLKEFLQEAFPAKAVKFAHRSLMDLIVQTEYLCSSKKKNRLDILILDPKESTLYAIEHKIKAKEGRHGKSSTQLKFYKSCLQKNKRIASFKQKNYIFLTPTGINASDEEWVSLSYDNIERVVTRILEFYSHKLLPEFKTVLGQYLNTIKRSILMSDETLNSLCQSIYQLHKKTIEYIISNADDPIPYAIRMVKQIFEKHSESFEINSSGKWIFCSLKEFDKYKEFQKPITEKDTRFKKSYVGLLVEANKKKEITIKCILGPTEKQQTFRKKLQKYFIQKNYTKHKQSYDKYHTVSTDILLSANEVTNLFEDKAKETTLKSRSEEKILKLHENFTKHLEEAFKALKK